jgi:hypothetical protein
MIFSSLNRDFFTRVLLSENSTSKWSSSQGVTRRRRPMLPTAYIPAVGCDVNTEDCRRLAGGSSFARMSARPTFPTLLDWLPTSLRARCTRTASARGPRSEHCYRRPMNRMLVVSTFGTVAKSK